MVQSYYPASAAAVSCMIAGHSSVACLMTAFILGEGSMSGQAAGSVHLSSCFSLFSLSNVQFTIDQMDRKGILGE